MAGYTSGKEDPISRNIDNESVDTENANNDIYAKEQDGPDLSTKIDNALSALKGDRGAVIVTPKDDGTIWSWGGGLTVDPSSLDGVEIIVRETVRIEYSGSGYVFDIAPSSVPSTQAINSEHFVLKGGNWYATGNPSGFVKATDAFGLTILPQGVHDFENLNNDARGIHLINDSQYCENWHIGGQFRGVDIAVDFEPASVSGGPGTESFSDGHLEDIHVAQVKNIGVRWRGEPKHSQATNPTIMPGADNATMMLFDTGSAAGLSIISMESEDPGNEHTGATVFKTGANYNENAAPVIYSSDIGSSIDNLTDYNAPEDVIWLRGSGQDEAGDPVATSFVAGGNKAGWDDDGHAYTEGYTHPASGDAREVNTLTIPLAGGSSDGWTNVLQFDHDGGNNRAVLARTALNLAALEAAGKTESGADNNTNNDGSWGTTGDTTTITTHVRWKVDDSDNTTLYLQINHDADFQIGFLEVTTVMDGATTQATVYPNLP